MRDGMKYVVMLNLKNAAEGRISKEELFEQYLQHKVPDFMIWGMGDTEENALRETMKNLCEFEVVHISLSDRELCDFIAKHGGREAVRHCWIDYNNDPHLLPRADVLCDFCEKYNLPKEAKEELERLFSSENAADLESK